MKLGRFRTGVIWLALCGLMLAAPACSYFNGDDSEGDRAGQGDIDLTKVRRALEDRNRTKVETLKATLGDAAAKDKVEQAFRAALGAVTLTATITVSGPEIDPPQVTTFTENELGELKGILRIPVGTNRRIDVVVRDQNGRLIGDNSAAPTVIPVVTVGGVRVEISLGLSEEDETCISLCVLVNGCGVDPLCGSKCGTNACAANAEGFAATGFETAKSLDGKYALTGGITGPLDRTDPVGFRSGLGTSTTQAALSPPATQPKAATAKP